MKEKIKKTYLGSRSVYLTRLEPTVLVVGGVEVVMKSINKKNMLANNKKRTYLARRVSNTVLVGVVRWVAASKEKVVSDKKSLPGLETLLTHLES